MGDESSAPASEPVVKSLKIYKEKMKAELSRLEAQSTAKDVAGKAIGKHGLVYITIIVVVGVGASLILEADKIAAVMGLLGSSLTALISMLAGIAGASEKEEKPEFAVIRDLIDKLDRKEQETELIAKLDKLDRAEPPMKVDVDGDHVTVTRGDDVITTKPNK
jgi:hypothetical protein